ncbi:VAC8 protein, partial [Polypterus senegalus]
MAGKRGCSLEHRQGAGTALSCNVSFTDVKGSSEEDMIGVRCPCLKKDKENLGKDREPVLQRHEREAAQEFLQHLDTESDQPLLNQQCLHALKTLSISENPKLQQSAAIYYLHISQQVTKETVVQMGLLEPILELLGSGDQTVQCNSCACVAMLATSASNREAIVSIGGILPLLVLCKSYEPRVQQNAIGAILNLTRSETTREVLCKEGALPLLMILLQSPDSEIQYYSCAALSNIATCSGHHMALLQVGNCFLLKTLLSLMLSSVEKICCQSCCCLRNLSVNVHTQEDMISMGCIKQLAALLQSSSKAVWESAVTLLSALSQHPPNRDEIVNEGILETLGKWLLQSDGNCMIVFSHISLVLKNLNDSKYLQIQHLVSLAIQQESAEVAFHAACIIRQMQAHDADFSAAIQMSPILEQLHKVQKQTDKTQDLLRMAMLSSSKGDGEENSELSICCGGRLEDGRTGSERGNVSPGTRESSPPGLHLGPWTGAWKLNPVGDHGHHQGEPGRSWSPGFQHFCHSSKFCRKINREHIRVQHKGGAASLHLGSRSREVDDRACVEE